MITELYTNEYSKQSIFIYHKPCLEGVFTEHQHCELVFVFCLSKIHRDTYFFSRQIEKLDVTVDFRTIFTIRATPGDHS